MEGKFLPYGVMAYIMPSHTQTSQVQVTSTKKQHLKCLEVKRYSSHYTGSTSHVEVGCNNSMGTHSGSTLQLSEALWGDTLDQHHTGLSVEVG